jgi:hypothetical protein
LRALIIFFLFVLILTPGLLLGILESPWFFLILFALLLLFPIVLAPKVGSSGGTSTSSGSGEESMGPIVWILVGTMLFFALPVLIIGFVLIPGFFLLILLVMAPLIYLMLRS